MPELVIGEPLTEKAEKAEASKPTEVTVPPESVSVHDAVIVLESCCVNVSVVV